MTSHRLARVNVQIQREISDILFRRVQDPRIGFVTVTGVKVSKDYDTAAVYVSLFGSETEVDASWKGLERARSFIRLELGKRIRLRKTPEIVFRLDDSIERAARIEQEIKMLDVCPEGTGDEKCRTLDDSGKNSDDDGRRMLDDSGEDGESSER